MFHFFVFLASLYFVRCFFYVLFCYIRLERWFYSYSFLSC
nr:MAG TPA: hypothetical protein [Microviridae sp.]